MKKIIYLSMFLMFSASLVNASIIKDTDNGEKDFKIVKIEEGKKVTKGGKILFFTRYKGQCQDGHTFRFTAYTRETAQNVVDAYCARRKLLAEPSEGSEEINEN
jgi:hypothetical protein